MSSDVIDEQPTVTISKNVCTEAMSACEQAGYAGTYRFLELASPPPRPVRSSNG